jgi:hypothetical protein
MTAHDVCAIGSKGKVNRKRLQRLMRLVFLPPYAPQANPDEYLNRNFKSALRLGPVSHTTQELIAKTQTLMQRLATVPARVQGYFKHPAAPYACLGI